MNRSQLEGRTLGIGVCGHDIRSSGRINQGGDLGRHSDHVFRGNCGRVSLEDLGSALACLSQRELSLPLSNQILNLPAFLRQLLQGLELLLQFSSLRSILCQRCSLASSESGDVKGHIPNTAHLVEDGLSADLGRSSSAHSASHPCIWGTAPAHRANSTEAASASGVAQTSVVLQAVSAAHALRCADDHLLGTREIDTAIVAESIAVGSTRTADTAANVVITGFAFGVKHQSVLFAISPSVVTLASTPHSVVIQCISEFPGVASSPSVLTKPAEKPLI